jgi:hypothetical protein
MLREAKESAEEKSKQEEEYEETRKAHFGAQFDDFQGTCYHGYSNKGQMVFFLLQDLYS